ncbi:AgmX/PglI C-terminal domain-containing protein [Kaarinaea lacus]
MASSLNRPSVVALAVTLLMSGFNVNADFDEATKAYLLGQYEKARYEALIAATDGNPKAQMLLGQLYFNGEGVPKDIPHALHWYNKAAENGFADAQYRLGLLYHDGKQGVERNLDLAYKWLSSALKGGNENAKEKLEWLHKTEQGNVVNLNENVEVLKQVAAGGNQQARFLLSQKMIKGAGIPQDKAGAVKMIKEDAEVGFVKAQKQLGELFFYGDGTEKDYIEAYAWSMAYAGTKELGGIAREGKQIARSALRKLPEEEHNKAYIKSQEYFENYVLPFHKNAREVGPDKYRIVVRSQVKKEDANKRTAQAAVVKNSQSASQAVSAGDQTPGVSISKGLPDTGPGNDKKLATLDEKSKTGQASVIPEKESLEANESQSSAAAPVAGKASIEVPTKAPTVKLGETLEEGTSSDATGQGILQQSVPVEPSSAEITGGEPARQDDPVKSGKVSKEESTPVPQTVETQVAPTGTTNINTGPVVSREDLEVIPSEPLGVATPENASKTDAIVLPERNFEDVYNVLVRKKSGLYQIYTREYELDKKLEGRVVFEITVAPDGKISAVEVLSNTLESPTLEQEFIDFLKTNVAFAPAEVANFKITYPVDFLPP